MSRLAASILAALAVVAAREVPYRTLPELRRADVEFVGTVADVRSAHDGAVTRWTFAVTVESLVRGDGLEVGAPAEIAAWTKRPAGDRSSLGHRGSFGGFQGLPERGDRVRVFADRTPRGLEAVLPNGLQPAAPSVAFVAADDEYRSEVTMPLLAELLARDGALRTPVIVAADPATGAPDVRSKTATTGTVPLREAHAAVLFLRFSRDEQLARTLEAFTRDGRPVVGFRTSTHAFAFGAESPLGALDDGFGERVFGTPWRRHHGHGSATRLLPPDPDAARHPILRGTAAALAEEPLVPSWLYVVEPLPVDCRVLLYGETRDPAAAADPQRRQPVLWVRETAGAGAPVRTAYTSLGHPGDLEHPVVRRIAMQMVLWALGDEERIPPDGVDAELGRVWSAPPTR